MATRYEVEVSRTAERQLLRLAPKDQARVVRAVRSLADDPRPRGTRKLAGYDDVFRIRVGLFRILYSISSRKLVVIILKVGHRRDIYR